MGKDPAVSVSSPAPLFAYHGPTRAATHMQNFHLTPKALSQKVIFQTVSLLGTFKKNKVLQKMAFSKKNCCIERFQNQPQATHADKL